jgi:hypothetical protein
LLRKKELSPAQVSKKKSDYAQMTTLVVLSFSQETITCGFGGESAPRCILRNPFCRSRPRAQRECAFFSLYEVALETMETIFFGELMIPPAQCRVAVYEQSALPRALRRHLSRVLSGVLRVAAVAFVPAGCLPLHTTGLSSGVAIDVGCAELSATAAFCGAALAPRPCRRYIQHCGIACSVDAPGGAGALAEHVARLLLDALAGCPVDVRAVVAQNVVVSGCPMLLAHAPAARICTALLGLLDRNVPTGQSRRWASLLPPLAKVHFASDGGDGELLPGSTLAWVGGSLRGDVLTQQQQQYT